MKAIGFVTAFVLLASFAGHASAGMVQPGGPQIDPSYTYELFEPVEGSEYLVTALNEGVYPGFVVLTEHPGFSIDPSNWSDIVEFTYDGTKPLAQQSTAIFYSDVDGQAFPSELVSRVQLAEQTGQTVYLPERYYPTIYTAVGSSGCTNTYKIYSDVPEPVTLSLLAIGALAIVRRRQA